MFDSHCHLTDPQFAGDLDAVLDRALEAGVHGIVTIASSARDAEAAHALAFRGPIVGCTAGIHPHEAAASDATFGRIVEMAGWPRVVAIGETGLDYHYDHSPREAQRRSFDRHLALAADTGLPVVVHCRSADDDLRAALAAAGPVVLGVLHCFTGGAELFQAGLEAGWYFSFGGMLTFRSFAGMGVIRAVPADRLLLETDGPYLAPVPWRGRRNEPAFLAATVERAAAILGMAPPLLAERTERNARAFYRLDPGAGAG
jgi:TatD DNase family protein